MTRPLARRTAALEGRAGEGWRPWAARPAEEWPDAALVAFLADGGAWAPLPGAAEPSDAELRAIAAARAPEVARAANEQGLAHVVPEP